MINRAFCSGSEMVWYFIGVYIVNRTSHGRLEIRNFSSSVEKYFTSQRSERVKYFSTLKEKFRITKRSCNILSILQFHRGRRPRREKWVLGLFDTQYVPARPYLQLVGRRNAATLLDITQRQVQPGSIVCTDQWAAYRQMQRRLGLHHRTVNHSLHFVDPVTGVHTQHAESNWSASKEKFKKMKGNRNPNFLIDYLHESMWRRWYGDPHPNECFQRLLQDIAEQNPL